MSIYSKTLKFQFRQARQIVSLFSRLVMETVPLSHGEAVNFVNDCKRKSAKILGMKPITTTCCHSLRVT